MHRLIMGCLVLGPILVSCGGDSSQSDPIRARQAEIRTSAADESASMAAAVADVDNRWARRQQLFERCMEAELTEAEHAELLGFEMGSNEWRTFITTVIESPLEYIERDVNPPDVPVRAWRQLRQDRLLARTAAPAAPPTGEPSDIEILDRAERRHAEAMAESMLADMRLMLVCWYVATADI